MYLERNYVIRLHLPRRLFLPVSRADLLELIEAQDKIVNKIKDISGLMLGRRMQFPADIDTAIREYGDTAIAAVAAVVTPNAVTMPLACISRMGRGRERGR